MRLLVRPELVPPVREALRIADVAVVDGQAVGAVDGSIGDHRQRRVVAARVGDPILQATEQAYVRLSTPARLCGSAVCPGHICAKRDEPVLSLGLDPWQAQSTVHRRHLF